MPQPTDCNPITYSKSTTAPKLQDYSPVGYIVRGNIRHLNRSSRIVPPSNPDELLPLSTPVLQVLLTLSEGDLHGYGIMGDVSARTEGEVNLSTSTLYGAIKRMMRDGLVEASGVRGDPGDDQRRRYYCITDFGRLVLHAEARRIERLAEMVRGKRFRTGAS